LKKLGIEITTIRHDELELSYEDWTNLRLS
jgi:hypothetical protein